MKCIKKISFIFVLLSCCFLPTYAFDVWVLNRLDVPVELRLGTLSDSTRLLKPGTFKRCYKDFTKAYPQNIVLQGSIPWRFGQSLQHIFGGWRFTSLQDMSKIVEENKERNQDVVIVLDEYANYLVWRSLKPASRYYLIEGYDPKDLPRSFRAFFDIVKKEQVALEAFKKTEKMLRELYALLDNADRYHRSLSRRKHTDKFLKELILFFEKGDVLFNQLKADMDTFVELGSQKSDLVLTINFGWLPKQWQVQSKRVDALGNKILKVRKTIKDPVKTLFRSYLKYYAKPRGEKFLEQAATRLEPIVKKITAMTDELPTDDDAEDQLIEVEISISLLQNLKKELSSLAFIHISPTHIETVLKQISSKPTLEKIDGLLEELEEKKAKNPLIVRNSHLDGAV